MAVPLFAFVLVTVVPMNETDAVGDYDVGFEESMLEGKLIQWILMPSPGQAVRILRTSSLRIETISCPEGRFPGRRTVMMSWPVWSLALYLFLALSP
jgi:hypothetical protein